jgi:hypothetical protein
MSEPEEDEETGSPLRQRTLQQLRVIQPPRRTEWLA